MILITGSSGFLGLRLASHLHNLGFKLRLATSNKNFIASNILKNVEKKLINFSDNKSIRDSLNGIETIIYLISMNSQDSEKNPNQAKKVNISYTNKFIKNAAKFGTKNFIYFSTVHVYGKQEGFLSEHTNLNPLTIYSKTHCESEKLIEDISKKNKSLNSVIIRLSNAFGSPLDKESSCWKLIINNLSKEIMQKKSITLNSITSTRRDFVPINYILATITNLISEKNNKKIKSFEIYNLSSGFSKNLLDIANILSQRSKAILGYTPQLIINNNKVENASDLEISNYKVSKILKYKEKYFFDEIDNLLIDNSKWFKSEL